MSNRKVMQQALEALEDRFNETNIEWGQKDRAITALKAALGYWDIGEDNPDSLSKHPAFRRAPQQQAEPVAYIHRQGNHWEVSERFLLDDEKARGWTEEPIYTTPPQRKPLTDEAIWLAYQQQWHFHPAEEPNLAKGILQFARAIEAAHNIKEGT